MSDCSLYAAPRAALADPGACPWQRVAGPADGVTAFALHGTDRYLVTHREAPRSSLVVVSVGEPDLGAATVVVPGNERAVVGVRVVGDHLLVHERDAGMSRVARLPLGGGAAQEVPLPVDGVVEEWVTGPGRAEAFEVTDLRVPARDGTLVPLRVVHRRGLVLDGANPAILTGHGSYGLVVRQLFAPGMLAWYERGGVCAFAGLRGRR